MEGVGMLQRWFIAVSVVVIFTLGWYNPSQVAMAQTINCVSVSLIAGGVFSCLPVSGSIVVTPTPLSTPTPAPTSTAGGSLQVVADNCNASIVNGQPLPACTSTSWFPSTSGLYRRIISSTAAVDPNSAAMVSSYFGTVGGASDDLIGLLFHNGVGQQSYSYGRPVYMAKTTDPLVTIHCTVYCVTPSSISAYVPANALREGGTDFHLSIIQPTTNVLIDTWLWQSTPPYTNGQSINVGSLAITTDDGTTYSGYDITPGWMSNAVTAGGMVGPAGQITLADLQAGVIQHELYGVVSCTASVWYAPATQTARVCTDGRTAIPDGALLQYTMSDAAIAASGMSAESKIIATAMHDYGVRISDDGICSPCSGGGMSIQVENQASFWAYGSGADPFVAYAIAHGWNNIVVGGATPPINRYSHELTDMSLPTYLRVMANGV